ncbi:hypothetical protein CN498_09960 [Bacillus thuringiensis]|uniref:Uncharacterized protein n=1 Tax=Bacillus thuringiensis TaxID=1428 RepID=A0A9X6YBE3_BACTU|nr:MULTISPECIES: hypothetical protein [Bacillus cereus group]KAA6469527.1 hypothetical protein DX930_07530 [Bacillus cereus]KAB2418741.1 hypothetical protein F8169_01580 [Bacillus cereus]KAB2423504.1 hypothetical protein F8167_10950 [Bacillus cereus]KAB2437751.1 hypothetical protein F8166_07580 [Bacillus cereus]KAB2468386.1 hypothetical protein F8164_08400 [Bacillus cereus]
MMEKKVEGMNRYVRIFLISIIMSVIWFTIQDVNQLTFNYQTYDLLMGSICFVIVCLFYDKL